jgi:quercetin dioxygenase-like cupin family protein/alkylhydroperoxidase/carboxymuconolactone decarboxylase family protein YurZ
MNKKITILLASILAALFTIATFSEAQTMTKGGLNAKQEKIVAIAAFTANGDQQKLKTALVEGLDAGLTVNEIKEILVQMYAYCGFPRSLNSINAFMGVLEEREHKGIKDEIGKEASPLPANKTSVELGTEILTSLTGTSAAGKYSAFTPAIDTFLKGHLFGDIFGRDNLDFQSREIATISALAALERVNPQLQSHINIGFNVGLTEMQMRGLISILAVKVGKKEADNASDMLSPVLSARQTQLSQPMMPSIGTLAAAKEDSQTISIARSDSQPSTTGSVEYFTGTVRVDPLFQPHEPSRASGASVTFEPGARTAWHIHPFGQTLIVTAGAGRIQRWGGPVEEIRQGDVVWIPAGLKHWHGAATNSSMTHIAIQEQLNGKTVDWKEKVSDEQYEIRNK